MGSRSGDSSSCRERQVYRGLPATCYLLPRPPPSCAFRGRAVQRRLVRDAGKRARGRGLPLPTHKPICIHAHTLSVCRPPSLFSLLSVVLPVPCGICTFSAELSIFQRSDQCGCRSSERRWRWDRLAEAAKTSIPGRRLCRYQMDHPSHGPLLALSHARARHWPRPRVVAAMAARGLASCFRAPSRYPFSRLLLLLLLACHCLSCLIIS